MSLAESRIRDCQTGISRVKQTVSSHTRVIWFIRQSNNNGNHHQTQRYLHHQLCIQTASSNPSVQLLLPSIVATSRWVIVVPCSFLLLHVPAALEIALSPAITFVKPCLNHFLSSNSFVNNLEGSVVLREGWKQLPKVATQQLLCFVLKYHDSLCICLRVFYLFRMPEQMSPLKSRKWPQCVTYGTRVTW